MSDTEPGTQQRLITSGSFLCFKSRPNPPAVLVNLITDLRTRFVHHTYCDPISCPQARVCRLNTQIGVQSSGEPQYWLDDLREGGGIQLVKGQVEEAGEVPRVLIALLETHSQPLGQGSCVGQHHVVGNLKVTRQFLSAERGLGFTVWSPMPWVWICNISLLLLRHLTDYAHWQPNLKYANFCGKKDQVHLSKPQRWRNLCAGWRAHSWTQLEKGITPAGGPPPPFCDLEAQPSAQFSSSFPIPILLGSSVCHFNRLKWFSLS